MSKYRSEISNENKSTKNKTSRRKPPKVPLNGWFTDDNSDDLDIGPWMIRRVNGETKKGHRKGHKDKSDPRAAPPHNKFLWTSKAMCKGIENEALFSRESLHQCFAGSIQVVLSKDTGLQINPKENGVDSGKSHHTFSENQQNDCETFEKHSQPISSNKMSPSLDKTTVHESADDKQLATDRRESEVVRLKRLIAIARKHRYEHLTDHAIGFQTDCEMTLNGCICKRESVLNDDDFISSEFQKNELTHSNFICTCNDEDSYGNSISKKNGASFQIHNHPKIRYSYTQGNNIISIPCEVQDKHSTLIPGANGAGGGDTVESTPFITALNNYSYDDNGTGLQPLVRSLKSANKYFNLKRNKYLGTPSPDSGNGSQSMTSGENGSAQHCHGDSKLDDVTSTFHNHNNTSKAGNSFINIPNRKLNGFVSSNIDRHYTALQPTTSSVLRTFREQTIESKDSPNSNFPPSNGVFPICDIIPDVYTASNRKELASIDSESGNHDNTSITAQDLLMHKGERADKIYLIQRPTKMLGPPPFRSVSQRTPLHRARDTAQKRILGHTFAQETQDLYQKLLSCKHGIIEPKLDQHSTKRRADHRNL